jgi:CheY-like chemotaxis protein
VLLMSGFNEQEAVARFAGTGLAGFIQKPFTLPALREKLQEILR